uniref:Uncharacterized protein n=1 Tax=Rhizophora mucronata TaxID=61149 RepID=A0A2P2QVM1_RHIMU
MSPSQSWMTGTAVMACINARARVKQKLQQTEMQLATISTA